VSLLCLLAVFISCVALAKTSKAKKNDTSTKTIVSDTSQEETILLNNLNGSSNYFAATVPLFNEVNSIVTLDYSLFMTGFFYGFLLMVILVNFICYVLFSDKVFGYFGLALIAFAGLFFNADNLVSLFIFDISTINIPLTTTLLCLTMGLISLFSSNYLSIKDSFPKLSNLTIPLFVFTAIMALSTWFTDNSLFEIIANMISFILIGIYFSASILLFNKKKYAKLYVIATCIPFLISIDYFLLTSFGVELLSNHIKQVKTAFFIEILVMTYAIIYRMQVIKEENIIQKTEMQLFLKRQETLSRDSIVRKNEDVYLENLIMHYDLDGLEIKLLQYISEGKTNKKIAKKLNTTITDVKHLRKSLYHKLEISEAVKEDYELLDSQPDYLYN
jgi:DNA-binding CsgD family transcriptional regulator